MEKIDSKEELVQMIRQYQNLVFSICLKMTGDYFAAEDLTQDTFVAVYQHLGKMENRMENEKAWICRIAANKCIDYKRQSARKIQPVLQEELALQKTSEQWSEVQNEPLQQILNQEILDELKICCNNLSPPYKEVALAYFVEGKTAREIAQQTGTGLKTTQTHIYRAREILRKFYRKERPEE